MYFLVPSSMFLQYFFEKNAGTIIIAYFITQHLSSYFSQVHCFLFGEFILVSGARSCILYCQTIQSFYCSNLHVNFLQVSFLLQLYPYNSYFKCLNTILIFLKFIAGSMEFLLLDTLSLCYVCHCLSLSSYALVSFASRLKPDQKRYLIYCNH